MKRKVIGYLLAGALAAGGVTYVSTTGIEHTAAQEGLRHKAYPDPATGGKPWTICYGHTKGVKPGMVVSQDQCERWLAEDLYVAERVVQKHVRVPLNQGQYDALVSFVFNVGEGNFRSSTLLRLLNQKKYVEACSQFSRWVYANKRVMNGLKKRRYEEQAMCLRPDDRIVYYATPKA